MFALDSLLQNKSNFMGCKAAKRESEPPAVTITLLLSAQEGPYRVLLHFLVVFSSSQSTLNMLQSNLRC